MTATTPPIPIATAGAERASSASPLWPSASLRLEGALLLVIAVVVYGQLGSSWWLFAALFLAPDVGMLGYLAGPRIGAAAYNLTHALSLPLLLGTVGLIAGSELSLTLAATWVAHIGADRALGYGLKYPTHFRDTHLQRLG